MRSRRCTGRYARSSKPAAVSQLTRRRSSYCISPSRTPASIGAGQLNGPPQWGNLPSNSARAFRAQLADPGKRIPPFTEALLHKKSDIPLRHDRIDAPWFIEGPIDGESFRTYVEK